MLPEATHRLEPHLGVLRHLAHRARSWGSRRPTLVFLRALWTSPSSVGAAWPSSVELGRQIARLAQADPAGKVVELGGGTGVVTRALLQQGIAPERLVVIEKVPELADLLRGRFPRVHVIEGDAAELAKLVSGLGKVSAVVSGLPLRSLPSRTSVAIVRQVHSVLPPGGVFVQFSYHLPYRRGLSTRFRTRDSRLVWWNLPPARVSAYAKREPASSGLRPAG